MEQREYVQVIGGVSLTFLLTEEQAAARGLTDSDLVSPAGKSTKPSNKGRTPRNK